MLANFSRQTLLFNLIGRHYSTATRRKNANNDTIRPIVNKTELDSIQADDPRHYKKVAILDGYESNAISYNPRVHYFIKKLMDGGKSWLSRRLVDRALYEVKLRQVEKFNKEKDEKKRAEIETNPEKIFLNGIENCKPLLKLTPIKKGGITYQVPVPMSDKEREFRAVKMLISSSNEKNKDVRFWTRLGIELIEAHNNQGRTVSKKIEIHKQAEQNRAYAQYRWKK